MSSPNRFLFIWYLFFSFTLFLKASNTSFFSSEELSEIKKKFSKQERLATLKIKENPTNISYYSKRGDARLFLGNISGSRDDYEKMILLNPNLKVSHWRLGIAYFYLSDFSKASRQFELYHQYDNVDRENGIWRFMSQYKEIGLKKAREGLLIYQKDDRPPYPLLYSMFAGEISPMEVFQKIKDESYPKKYETRVLFHANFYVGIFLELTGNSPQEALQYLASAVNNEYGRITGTFMWQVARIHQQKLKLLFKKTSAN